MQNLVRFFVLSVAVLFVVTQCDAPPSGSTAEPEPVLDIPAFGPDALPTITGKNGIPLTKGDSQLPPAYHLLKKYADKHPENPYVAVVGIWHAAKDRYEYKAIPLVFPDEIFEVANGRIAHYTYRLKSKEDGIYRTLAAFIPPYRTAAAMMNEWLKFKNQDAINKTGSDQNQQNILAGAASHESNLDYLQGDEECTGDFAFCAEGEEITITPPDDPNVYEPDWPSDDGGGGGEDGGDDGGSSGPGGGSAGNGGLEMDDALKADLWEARIDDDELAPCMQDELDLLATISEGVGEIVQDFAIDELDVENLNWKVKDGELPGGVNGRTFQQFDTKTNTVTTTFDANKFDNATNLAVARSIIHEAVHGYLIAYFNVNPFEATEGFPHLVDDLRKEIYPDQNTTQHAEFVRNFVGRIATSLKEFGNRNGYSFSNQFYTDLAWGGLTEWPKRDSNDKILKDNNGNIIYEETPWFKKAFTNVSDRDRIKDNISKELNNRNHDGSYGGGQKGNDSGC